MLTRLYSYDARVIAHYVGLLTIGIGLSMSIPLLTALLLGEWDPAMDYLFGMGVACATGTALMHADTRNSEIDRVRALAITALGWIAASAAAAVPLALSPHYGSFIDAMFDSLSGLTTTGLTVVTDLDHMAHSHNMWRHLTQLIGGQGIVVAALSLAIGTRTGAHSLYVAEGRDERILPNIIHTARFIWFVTALYVVLGTAILTGVHTYLGMDIVRGSLHAFWISIATYDTGGFAPQSMNAMYYHSFLFEVVTLFLMLAGTMNFSLHAQVWRGDRSELWRSLEMRTLGFNIFFLSALASLGLAATSAYTGPLAIFRKGAYHIISAHSAGHQTVYTQQWSADVGPTAFLAVMLAMAAGGGMSSTAGGIKALRLGLLLKTIWHQIRVSMAPRSAVIRTTFHHLGKKTLTPELAGMITLIFVLYTLVYLAGGVAGAAYGYYPPDAMFESISATANSGPSAGITGPDMPLGLKIVYMFQMWAGRLEFIAVLTVVTQLIVSFAAAIKTLPNRI